MYQKDNSALLRTNASALTKNVSVLSSNISEDFQLHVAVIHKSTINVVKPNTEQGTTGSKAIICKDSNGTCSNMMILQTKWCTLHGKTVLVIGYQKGVQIFDWDGSVLLFWHVFTALPNAEKKETFARGIATCGDSLICVGSHDGEILLFDVPEKETNISHVGGVKRDNSHIAIADLTSQDNLLVSVDNVAIITVWRKDNNMLKQVLNITNKDNDSCSVISCWKNIIVSGYSNGMLRLHDLHQGYLIAEVMAHTRWISGLDIAPLSGMVCTSSEDSYVRVWQLILGKKPTISHKYSKCLQDMQLCGIAFCEAKGSSFCTAAYDENELHFYSM